MNKVLAKRRGYLVVLTLASLVFSGDQYVAAAESTDQLIEKLSGRKTRSFGAPTAIPENTVNVDDAKCLFEEALESNSERALSGGSRALYVTDAPSVDLQIQFELDSSVLKSSAKSQLKNLATALNSQPLKPYSFIVAGHTDNTGEADYNRRLSCARANSVARFLSKEGGVDSTRLNLLGFGFTQLKDPENPSADVNRRVEIKRMP